ncbi:probable RNA polymerase II nuclear localization protein SLC7A6OS isoform X3 [Narcine bancroftii]|uniref:probable RNA polymerase II nuclear localization protein SLC7A6OS isoform X3 n=1 Tax=Narcine bancroftii TaxID=1343680 RepID=UPI0038317BDD
MIWMMHLRSIRTEGVDSGEERAQCSGGGGQRSAIRCRPSRPVAVTAASGPCPAMAAAVLRVKRKRGAEAAEALLLACKRPRTDGEPAPQQQVVRTLFRIAATVGSQDDTLQQHVKEAIFKEKALLALKPSSASAQRAHVNVRASRQAARQEGRYKVIASHRRNCLKSLNDENIDQKSDSNTSEAQEEGGCQKINGTASTSGKDGIGSAEEIEVFDVVHHEEDKGDSKHKHCTCGETMNDKEAEEGTIQDKQTGCCGAKECIAMTWKSGSLLLIRFWSRRGWLGDNCLQFCEDDQGEINCVRLWTWIRAPGEYGGVRL